jgi:hypothetical protein
MGLRQKIKLKIVAVLVIQAFCLSSMQYAYGGVLPEKSDTLSPQVTLDSLNFQNMFNESNQLLNSKDSGMNRRKFNKLIAAGALSLLIPSFFVSGSEAASGEINLSHEDAAENVEKMFDEKQAIRAYSEIAAVLKLTEMPVDIIIALDLTETDGRNAVRSHKGARGPMQIMKGTVNNYNKWLADKKAKKSNSEEFIIAQRLIGGTKIYWNKLNDPIYGRKVGAAIAYLKWHDLKRTFSEYGLVFNDRENAWEFKKAQGDIKPYPYLTTAALCAAYNGPGPARVYSSLKKYGPLPKVTHTDADKQKLYYDPMQVRGWLDAGYNQETKNHFIRLWRYYSAVQKFKKSNPRLWAAIIKGEGPELYSKRDVLSGFASVFAFGRIKKIVDAGKKENTNIIENSI